MLDPIDYLKERLYEIEEINFNDPEFIRYRNIYKYTIKFLEIQTHNINKGVQYKKKVYQYDLQGNFVREYNSVTQTKMFGFDPNGVCNNCYERQKTHKNYIFSYEKK